MTPEGKVKEQVKTWLDANMPGHWRVMPRGGPFGKMGCPDILICWRGIFIAIEVKSNVGTTTPVQMVQLKKIQEAGGIAAVLMGFQLLKLKAIREMVLIRNPLPTDQLPTN